VRLLLDIIRTIVKDPTMDGLKEENRQYKVENQNVMGRLFSMRCSEHKYSSHFVKSNYCCECGKPMAKKI